MGKGRYALQLSGFKLVPAGSLQPVEEVSKPHQHSCSALRSRCRAASYCSATRSSACQAATCWAVAASQTLAV